MDFAEQLSILGLFLSLSLKKKKHSKFMELFIKPNEFPSCVLKRKSIRRQGGGEKEGAKNKKRNRAIYKVHL